MSLFDREFSPERAVVGHVPGELDERHIRLDLGDEVEVAGR